MVLCLKLSNFLIGGWILTNFLIFVRENITVYVCKFTGNSTKFIIYLISSIATIFSVIYDSLWLLFHFCWVIIIYLFLLYSLKYLWGCIFVIISYWLLANAIDRVDVFFIGRVYFFKLSITVFIKMCTLRFVNLESIMLGGLYKRLSLSW